MAGRPPKPLALAKLTGAAKKNPKRYRAAIAVEDAAKEEAKTGIHVASVSPVGVPPFSVSSPAAIEAWNELVKYVPTGILTESDRILLEVAANLIAEYRISPNSFPVSKYPHLYRCLAVMGLTPADRRKLALPGDKKPTNPFEALMGGKAKHDA